MIPENCIENLKKKFNDEYPCISELHITSELFKSYFKKYEYLWYKSIGKTITEGLLNYDLTGIFLYHKTKDNDNMVIYFLSLIDKKNVVDFTIHNIINKNK